MRSTSSQVRQYDDKYEEGRGEGGEEEGDVERRHREKTRGTE
jgi:hypothetical protein